MSEKELSELLENFDFLKTPLQESTATEEEISLVKKSVFKIQKNIIYLYENNISSPFSVKLQGDKIEELTSTWDSFIILVDLTRATKPTAEVLRGIRKNMTNPKLKYSIAFTETNILLRVAAKFVLKTIMANRFTVVKSRNQAIQLAYNEIG